MKLITNEIKNKMPELYSQEHAAEPLAYVKFFTPWTSWTWYGMEFDGEDTFFGLVDGHDCELGYFSLSELESIRGPGGLRVERDLYFKATPVKTLQEQISRHR